MMPADTNLVREVAQAVGAGLMDDQVSGVLAERLIEVRLADFFRPIVRVALAEALNIDPEDIGIELVDEAVKESITAGYLAKRWLDEKLIPRAIDELRTQFTDGYEGFDNDANMTIVARSFLVFHDADIVLANAVRDGLLRRKA
jgi:hypothetical protein